MIERPVSKHQEVIVLILTRRHGEKIVIGDDIVISVEDIIQGRKVRIGVEAPKDVAVDRQEVREAKLKDRE